MSDGEPGAEPGQRIWCRGTEGLLSLMLQLSSRATMIWESGKSVEETEWGVDLPGTASFSASPAAARSCASCTGWRCRG